MRDVWLASLLLVVGLDAVAAENPSRGLIEQHCVSCHNGTDKTAGLDLDAISRDAVAKHTAVWENAVRKLRARQMPPADAPRPDDATYRTLLDGLETALDREAAAHPDPGRTDTFRRLTRTEYQNAVRDLLAIDIDAAAYLPPDEVSHGFDNITVGDLSPTLLDRYLTAAQRIARLAVGSPRREPDSDTIRVRADVTQEGHVPGLPLGTRGGTVISYHFPQAGEYEIQVRLARDRNEEVEGLTESHELELLIDREHRTSFTVAPPPGRRDWEKVDEHLKARIPVSAGPHQLGVTFVRESASLMVTKRQPYQAHFNTHRHPRQTPAVYQVTITGPYHVKGAGETPSRQRIFVSRPTAPANEDASARQILSSLMRRAYRRPVTEDDLLAPLALYHQGRAEGDFDAGIEMALSAILVNPQFLFRMERDPPNVAAGMAYRISDLELASRLSFFLWNSLPDDELLDRAVEGQLSQPATLRSQVSRMLADPRAKTLATNFAGQWLHLRNLDSITPDLRLFPDFDDNLRQALRQETELLFDRIRREDRSVLDLLKPGETYLNERLAKHYGIPHVYGERFRLVSHAERGGLLRQGSVLTVTSYATRTSPVIRGKWILENLLGTPPPPPPANVPALKDNTVAANLSVRERLAEHRANAACASCHNLMDPTGFALENYDAVGRFRMLEDAKPVDATGGLPDGRSFTGVAGLETALLDRPDVFVETLTEKLLTYALGRGIEPGDGPAIRKIVRGAHADGGRFSAVIVGIATSVPFQMRRAE
jgi:hypothetical protein